jgi:hypothetical protein
MMLVVCGECRRHVALDETACPFCAAPIVAARPQHALVTRLTRAAVFSAAALTSACKDKPAATPAPAPAPTHAGSGSDDLEKLLDTDEHVVEHPSPPSDAAVPIDAAVVAMPIDAGADEQERREKQRRMREEQRRAELKKKQLEQEQREKERLEQQQIEQQRLRVQNIPKPYGAPPARRRTV